ncbi:MAG: hypothetical protein ACJA2P_000715 [Rhodoferax sp.]|jgi:hypothetical protein
MTGHGRATQAHLGNVKIYRNLVLRFSLMSPVAVFSLSRFKGFH